MITLLFTTLLTSASAQTAAAPSPYVACVQQCQAWADTPDYQLKACLKSCERLVERPKDKFEGSEEWALRCQYEPSLCR